MKRILRLLTAATLTLSLFVTACTPAAPATQTMPEPSETTAVETTAVAPEKTAEEAAPASGAAAAAGEVPTAGAAAAAAEPVTYSQAPMLDDLDLPPVEERLPDEPKLVNEMLESDLDYEIGRYGGTLRTVTSVIDWDADVFCAANETLLNSPSIIGSEVTPNILADYEVSEDQMTFIFTLRSGLRWSDGEPVTMEDIRFTVEDVIFNTQLTPVVDLKFRSGASREGNPFSFEVLDEERFQIGFDEPYGGFLIRLALTGWVGYTDLLKPSHYLKPYHIDYASEEEMAAWDDLMDEHGIAKGEELSWVNLFNKIDITNWEKTRREAIGFPTLNPWMLISADQTTYYYVRNPYYFKVDAEGQQLPYIDRLESYLVADMEMVTLQAVSGEIDFVRESAALVNMPLYRENESKGYRAEMFQMHNTPTTINLNLTWGDDPGYHEMVRDVRFRQALSMAIDRDELIDSIYYGYAESSSLNPWTYDPEGAHEKLEEMGMEMAADGYYLRPDGEPFSILIEHGAEAPDIGPYCELVCEMWQDIGINATTKRIDQSLVGNKQAANELQARVIWIPTVLWYQMIWGFDLWGRAWNIWRTQTQDVTITNPDGTSTTQAVSGEEPPEEVLEFFNLVDSMMLVSVEDANEVYREIEDSLRENVWFIMPLEKMMQPLIVNENLRNVPETGTAIAVGFAVEQLWYDDAE